MLSFPTYRTLLKAFAEASAQRNIVPDANAGFGMASIENGFPIETMRPIDDQGIAPQGQDMNGILHLATSGLVYLQHGGMGFKFHQPIADLLQGYALGAVLSFDDPATPYCVMSTIQNNTINFNVQPSSIGNQWLLVPKVQQWNPQFNFPRGYMLSHNGIPYICMRDNGPSPSIPDAAVEPGTNTDFWEAMMTGSSMAGPDGRAFVGKIDLLPNRFSELPPGWYACYGTRYADYLPQGQALLSLSPTYRADWGITLTSDGINVPQLMSGGNGYFLRAVNGTTRAPGSVEQDAARPVTAAAATTTNTNVSSAGSSVLGTFTAAAYAYAPNGNAASGAFTGKSLGSNNSWSAGDGGGVIPVEYTMSSTSIANNLEADSSSSTSVTITQANQSTENRPLNIGMTPAIYLGV